jgi:hypothetical protein
MLLTQNPKPRSERDSRVAGCTASAWRDRPRKSGMSSPIINEHSPQGTRMLDAAKGILVGLRGYTMADAFSEILCVAAEYGVGPLSVSHALVALAEGSRQTYDTPATEAAYRTWASLVDRHARRIRRDDAVDQDLEGGRR